MTIILSVVLQSFVVVAEDHQLHEMQIDHHQADVDHVHLNNGLEVLKVDLDSDTLHELQHHTHLSGSQFAWTDGKVFDHQLPLRTVNTYAYLGFALQEFIEPKLRPPIV